jgi:hypothetical protein
MHGDAPLCETCRYATIRSGIRSASYPPQSCANATDTCSRTSDGRPKGLRYATRSGPERVRSGEKKKGGDASAPPPTRQSTIRESAVFTLQSDLHLPFNRQLIRGRRRRRAGRPSGEKRVLVCRRSVY